jgi:hypothetical protein
MANLTECVITIELANAIRTVTDALQLKVTNGNLQFRCPKCGNPVNPHREGEGLDGKDAAHFEHIPGYSTNCR